MSQRRPAGAVSRDLGEVIISETPGLLTWDSGSCDEEDDFEDVARKYLHDLAALYDWFVSFGATSPKSFSCFGLHLSPGQWTWGF